MPSYEKDLENQNYDLMVSLAELQQIVDDFRTIKGANEKFLLSIIDNNLVKIHDLTRGIIKLKSFLSENGFEEPVTRLEKEEIEIIEDSIEKHIQESIYGQSYHSSLANLVSKHIIPCLKSLELDGEDDEPI